MTTLWCELTSWECYALGAGTELETFVASVYSSYVTSG